MKKVARNTLYTVFILRVCFCVFCDKCIAALREFHSIQENLMQFLGELDEFLSEFHVPNSYENFMQFLSDLHIIFRRI